MTSRPGRRWGVRKRTVFAAVAIMAVVLALAGLVLLFVLRTTLISTARSLALEQLDAVVEAASAHGEGGFSGDLEVSGAQVAQILGAGGTVLASSNGTHGDPLYVGGPLSPGQSYLSSPTGVAGLLDFDDYIIAAQGVQSPGGTVVAVVGASTAVERDAVSTVGWFLLAAVPVLLVLAGMLMWFLVGRALEPVERIRRTVAGISAQNLDGRVEPPDTGDEIDRLARTMNSMLARLQKADETQRRFVTDASHELRSPLASLTTGLEVAVADATPNTWLESSAMLQTQAQRMGFLIEDLLTLAKIDDAGLRFRMADVDLDDVLGQEVKRLRSVSGHVIQTRIVPVRITGDASRLAQVIRNLMNNAERHAASIIRLSLSVSGATVRLAVENDGDRIGPEDRTRIFERFVRLDASRSRESGGSGLGLAISQEIVAAHGGTIEVGESGQGYTRFVVLLPLPRPAVDERTELRGP